MNQNINHESIDWDRGRLSEMDSDFPNTVENHLNISFGEDNVGVFHEIVSPDLHIDIFVIKPAKDRKYWILVTGGMSSLKMNVPPEFESLSRCELYLVLPENWIFDEDKMDNEANYWPIRLLKDLARIPLYLNTWLAEGHTLPSLTGSPYGNTNFMGSLVTVPMIEDERFRPLTEKNETIYFWSVMPLYQEEMDYKINKGTDALFNKFDQAGITMIIDPLRKNAVKSSGFISKFFS